MERRMVTKQLDGGPKTVNVLSDHIIANEREGTDRHPMFIVRYAGVAFFAHDLDIHGEVRAVCGCGRPMPKVDPFGVSGGKVVAWLETHAPVTLRVPEEANVEVRLPEGSYCGMAEL